jgi:hypothetical protein
MSRVTTIITGPDGSVTRIVTRRSGCGCLTVFAAIVVFVVPAGFGAWAVPAYIFLGVLVIAGAVSSFLRSRTHGPAVPLPPPPP